MGLRVGAVTFGGLASGLKTDEIIKKLLEAERRPIDQLEERRTGFGARLDIFRDLNTKTLRLRDALRKLDNLNLVGTGQSVEEEFSRFKATSSNTAIATATADGAAAGSVNVRVGKLASASRHVDTNGYANLTDTVGTGNFQITIGATSTALTIDGSNNTVQGFVDAINNSAADVTAFLINDGTASPLRIAIQGNQTGTASDVVLTNGLLGGSPQSPIFAETQDAANATVVLDPDALGVGITVQSATNTFENLVLGVTIQVRSTNSATLSDKISIAIEPDVDASVAAIQEVVDAFNEITKVINQQFEIDPETNRGGPLIGDSTLSDLQQRLSRVVASQIGSDTIRQAGQIGIRFDADGLLALDAEELRADLTSDLAGVRAFFSGAGSFSDQLRDVAQSFVDPVDGLLVTRIGGATLTISDLADQIAAAEERLGVIEEGLVRQFATLERLISNFQLQGNFLSQFLLQNSRG
jgi:flagellar hook-associated protein 2